MANKRHQSLSSRLRLQKKSKKDQPSILKEEEEKWNWTRIAILVVLIYAGMTFMNGCFSIIDLKAQQNAIVAQTQEAQSKQSDLENEVSYMQTQEAVEKTAREDLKMVKPGEILLTQRESTTDDQKKSQASTENSDTTE